MRKRASAFVIAVLMGCALVSAQQRPDLVSVIQRSGDALTAHDIGKFMSFCTDDFVQDNVSFPALASRKDFAAMVGGMLDADPGVENFPERVFTAGDLAFADGCSFVMTNPANGRPYRTYHADILTFEKGKIKVMTTFWEGAAGPVALGQIEATLPLPRRPGTMPWPADPIPTKLKPLDAQKEFQLRYNSHAPDALGKMLAQNAKILVSPLFEPVGRDVYLAWQGELLTAFPDLGVAPLRSIDFGDGWVVSEMKMSGTQKGAWLGNPPAGKTFMVRAALLGHYDSQGLATELRWYFNSLAILGQLGYKPVPISVAANDEAAIRAGFDSYASTLKAYDADGWMALWDENGVQLPPDSPMHVGKAAVKEANYEGIKDTSGALDMSITTQEVLLFGGGYGLARGIYTWTWTPKDGGAKADYDGKFMTLFKKQANGSWKIYRDSFNSNLPPK